MAKLYFKYGAMGSSKSAQALITKFNYEELGMRVWLIKPAADTRDGKSVIQSRIGLRQEADAIPPEADLTELYRQRGRHDVIIADECQFFTPEQIDQPPASGAGGFHHGDQDRLRLRRQGHRQRPHRRKRLCGHRRTAGLSGRQR